MRWRVRVTALNSRCGELVRMCWVLQALGGWDRAGMKTLVMVSWLLRL